MRLKLSGAANLVLVSCLALACSSKSGGGFSAGGGSTIEGGSSATAGRSSIATSSGGGGETAHGGTVSMGGTSTASGGTSSAGAPLGGTSAGGTPSTMLAGGSAGTSRATISTVGGSVASGGTPRASETTGTAGRTSLGGTSATSGGTGGTNAGGISTSSTGTGTGGTSASGGTSGTTGVAFPFPQNFKGSYCILPTSFDNEKVRTAYQQWKDATITSDGAGGFLRVKKPDSGTVIGSTVSEGIGYGMLLAVYMNDQPLFDGLWKYEQIHLGKNGLMDWEIGPDGKVTSGGSGAASDGDEDMAWALVMADRQWGGKGSLTDSYLNHAKKLIDLMWTYEIDQTRNYMLKPGDTWGNVDVWNPSYFAPAYYRVFGQVTGKTSDWNKVIAGNYDILEKSLNASSGNASNGLVPAWCNSSGTPVEAFSGAPKHFQNDSTRTPFRVGQDYCYFGEPRAKSYLDKITAFYVGVGVDKIVDGYDLNGTPHPDKATGGKQAASFVGPAGVGAMSDARYQSFLDQAYAAVATLNLTAGTIYYQKSWAALSLLMMTGNFVNFMR